MLAVAAPFTLAAVDTAFSETITKTFEFGPSLGTTKSVKKTVLTEYARLAAKYLNDWGNLDEEARPSDEKLKRCITLVKELRNKYDGFLQKLDSIREKLRGENRWTAELDEEFEKNASKVDADTRSEVKRKGGFRAFYQTSSSEFKTLKKYEFDTEIKALEKQIESSPSSENPSFQTASYAFGATDKAASQFRTTETAAGTAAKWDRNDTFGLNAKSECSL